MSLWGAIPKGESRAFGAEILPSPGSMTVSVTSNSQEPRGDTRIAIGDGWPVSLKDFNQYGKLGNGREVIGDTGPLSALRHPDATTYVEGGRLVVGELTGDIHRRAHTQTDRRHRRQDCHRFRIRQVEASPSELSLALA